MITAAPLGDIMQQYCDEQSAARADFMDLSSCARMIVFQQSALDLAEQPDCADRMLVDCVMVIHVELHLRVDPAKIGHEAAEHARLIHPAQRDFRVIAPAQQFEKQRIGALVLANLRLDQLGVAPGLPHGFRVDLETVSLGQLEHFDQPHWVFGKPIVTGRFDPPAFDQIAVQFARFLTPAREESATRALAFELLIEVGEEHAGEIADTLHLQEIELHEALDGAFAGAVGEVHAVGDFALQIEGQAIFRTACDIVHVAAHSEQEPLGTAETAILLHREQADIDKLARTVGAVDVFADPVQRLEIAQTALSVFHIGFDDIAAVAHPLVPRIALGELLLEKITLAAADDLGPEPSARLFVQLLVAPYDPPFEQRGADRQVFACHLQCVGHGSAGVTDLQPEIPQQVQDRLDHLFAPRRALHRSQESNIDIGMRCHFGAAITANRLDREPFCRRAIGRGMDKFGHVIVDHPDQLIDQEGMAVDALVTCRRLLAEPPGQFFAPRIERMAQGIEHSQTRRLALFLCQGCNPFR